MNIEDIKNIDDFIHFVYPEPKENDKNYVFFKAWGYEDYLIKTQSHDLDQLRVLLSADYNEFKLSQLLKSNNPEEALRGCELVKAKKILHGFLTKSAAKGWHGICLEKNNDGYFCVFPGIQSSLFKPLIRTFNNDEVEITDLEFTTEKDLFDLCDPFSPTSNYDLNKHVCKLPEYGIVYVFKTWSNDCYHGSFAMDYIPATFNEKKNKYIFSKNKKNILHAYHVDYSNVEDGRILE